MKAGWQEEKYHQQRVYHFIGEDTRSLCGKLMFYTGETKPDSPSGRTPKDCTACIKKLEKGKPCSPRKGIANARTATVLRAAKPKTVMEAAWEAAGFFNQADTVVIDGDDLRRIIRAVRRWDAAKKKKGRKGK